MNEIYELERRVEELEEYKESADADDKLILRYLIGMERLILNNADIGSVLNELQRVINLHGVKLVEEVRLELFLEANE